MLFDLVILILGFVIGFILAFSIGANDVANSFGPSVGSGVLTFKKACILATIFETLGSVFLGGRVSGTIAKGIADLELYADHIGDLQLGYLSALIGASGWLLVATLCRFPVSGTHSIVGAVLGFTLVANGTDGINWLTLLKIVASWFTSPVLSGIISAGLFYAISVMVLKRKNKLEAGARILPVLYGVTLATNMYMIFTNTFAMLKIDISNWVVALMAVAVGLICWTIAYMILLPWILKKVAKRVDSVSAKIVEENISLTGNRTLAVVETPKTPATSPLPRKCITFIPSDDLDSGHVSVLSISASNSNCPSRAGFIKKSNNKSLPISSAEQSCDILTEVGQSKVIASLVEIEEARKREELKKVADSEIEQQEPEDLRHLFSFIQVITAVFASFAHGGNDVSNAVGPIIGMLSIYQTGTIASKPSDYFQFIVLLFGGAGISVGLWLLGRRVMTTIGKDLVTISPASGFCIEFGAAFTVLIASHIGIPVSTTHCLVGSIVFVGFVRSRSGIDWKLVRNIIFSWGVTVPVACAFSATSYALVHRLFVLIGLPEFSDVAMANSTELFV